MAPKTMTSGNEKEADVKGGDKKEDDRMGTRRKMSSDGQDEEGKRLK